jgi:hypothetical protein
MRRSGPIHRLYRVRKPPQQDFVGKAARYRLDARQHPSLRSVKEELVRHQETFWKRKNPVTSIIIVLE